MKPFQKILIGGSLAGATMLGGAVGASLIGTAGAATNPTSTTAQSSTATPPQAPNGGQPPAGTPNGQPPAPDWSKAGHQANNVTEELLTGDTATKAEAAATAAVPGATAQRAETDAEGAAYEVHMTKSDGSVVTIKLDGNFAVTDTIDGMG